MSRLSRDLPDLTIDREDDIGFIHSIRPLIFGAVTASAAREVYVVKIDTWFGPKWLGFSHKVLGALAIWQSRLRLPPFVPSRVRSESYRSITHHGSSRTQPLHVKQTSSENHGRTVDAVCPHAALFWWSGSTLPNGRGCLMSYLPTPSGHTCWYAEFRRAAAWQPAELRNTSRPELERYAALGIQLPSAKVNSRGASGEAR